MHGLSPVIADLILHIHRHGASDSILCLEHNAKLL